MSIQDDNGMQIVTLNTLHAMAFRVLIWVGIIGTPAGAGLFWTMADKLSKHEERLQFHEWRLNAMEGRGKGSVTQSVNVGEAGKSAAAPSAKTWLTTQEVASREKVSDRTVINYIEAGMIEPQPQKLGKEWHIAEHYRIIPQDAENCSNTTPENRTP